MRFDVIPAIDLLDGKVVRLTQGDYEQTQFFDISPIDLIQKLEKAGARRIHIVDLNGAKDGELSNRPVYEALRKESQCEIELGGGIRSIGDAKALLGLGINYLIIGSLLIDNWPLAVELAETFPGKVIAGVDTKQGMATGSGWLKLGKKTGADLAADISKHPFNAIIFTDIAKDGMMQGPNLTELKIMAKAASIPIIASGGIRHGEDIQEIKSIPNVSGCIVGKAILNGNMPLSLLKNEVVES